MDGKGVPSSVPMPRPPLTSSRADVRPRSGLVRPELVEGFAPSWGRSAFATVVAVVLIGLGVANIATRARAHEVEDGVLWGTRAEGVTAVEVAPGSAGAVAGVGPGDILLTGDGPA